MTRWSTLCVTLVGLCAIDWYRPDGSQMNVGDYVYSGEQVQLIAAAQAADNPGYTYEIRCEE